MSRNDAARVARCGIMARWFVIAIALLCIAMPARAETDLAGLVAGSDAIVVAARLPPAKPGNPTRYRVARVLAGSIVVGTDLMLDERAYLFAIAPSDEPV